MTELPDIKLRALVNFPVAVTGRTATKITKVGNQYFIDHDVSGLVQNPGISAGDVAASWMTIWNKPLNSYQNVPYALAATAGVASIHGQTGALDIGNGLTFTGSTLDLIVGNGLVFTGSTLGLDAGLRQSQYATRALAAAATIPTSAQSIKITRRAAGYPLSHATYIPGTNTGPDNFAEAGGHYWQLDLSGGVVPVTWFGAKGDGSTDDAPAIQAAINAAQAIGSGAVVYIPAGNYACASRLTVTSSSITFRGDSVGASKLIATGAMTELLRVGPAAGATTRAFYVIVKDLYLSGGAFCSTSVFHFYNCIYSRFENIRIEGGAATGIQGDGNPNTSGNSGDPFTQGCFISKVSALNCGGYGHYYRGVKGSIFSDLESNGCAGHSFYWDMEQQAGGSNEITENVITNCIAKNGGNAGYAFSGMAKHNISNIVAYICAGAAVLFQPTISGTNAASFFNVISGLIARNCNGGVIVTADGAGVNGLVVNGVSVVGGVGTAIYMKGWIRFTLSNVVITGFQGNNITIDDDPTPPSGGSASCSVGTISDIVLIGASQVSTQAGIVISGHSATLRLSKIISNQAGGVSGFEISANSTTTSDIEISDVTLLPNTAGRELSIGGSSGVVFHGANRTNVTSAATLWMPRGSPSSTTFAGQLYEDSANSNKLSWMDSAGTKHVINTTP